MSNLSFRLFSDSLVGYREVGGGAKDLPSGLRIPNFQAQHTADDLRVEELHPEQPIEDRDIAENAASRRTGLNLRLVITSALLSLGSGRREGRGD